MTHTHSWYKDHYGHWYCHDCDIELTHDAVQMLRFLGHTIEVDYARLDAKMTPQKEDLR
jgi:hypothetical protein